MKKKFSRILGVGLTVALLTSLMLVAAPVSAGTLSWTAFSPVPSSTSQVLVDNVSVVDIAVYGDGDTIYVGGGENITYKSTDRGLTWSTITTDNQTDLIAVAPDDADIIAYADNSTVTVWVSTDGGTNWGSIGRPEEGTAGTCENITDIAISAESSGIHYIAVTGHEAGPIANVWYWDLGDASPYWHETNDLVGLDTVEVTTANSTALAVEFSPNFPSDQVMAVLMYRGDYIADHTDNISLELFSYNQKKWNDDAAFDDYSVKIVTDDGITGVSAGSITLGPDYLGSDDAMRLAFIGLTLTGNSDAVAYNGIYRADDTTVKALKDGSAVEIHSVAYDGSTLVAGRYDSNICYYSTDPTATTPTFSSTRALKRPGMSDNTKAVVVWAGEDVVAGTTGDSSAFAVSTNNGKSFSDISLIDTVGAVTGNMTDVAMSSDGSVTYMATDDSDGMSLWRYASAWERVLAVPDKDDFIIRIAPDDPDVVYVVDEDDTTIYYSADAGEERWQTRTSRYDIQDLAIEGDGEVAYVIVATDGKVSKSTNAGFTWGSSKSSKLAGGYMIVSLDEDKILAASDDGYVAYSTDGGDSWTKIGKAAGGNELVAIASGLATDDYIYVGTHDTDTTDRNVYRWQLGVNTSWDTIMDEGDILADYKAYSINLEDGILYVSTANGSDSSTFRTLNPTDAVMPTWSTANSSAVFDLVPQGLKIGAGSMKLWSIDSESKALYSFTDTIADAGPTLVSPTHGSTIAVNPVTGYAMDVAFTWEKPSAKVTSYQLKIALDEGFDETVKTITYASTSSTVSAPVGKDTDNVYSFMPGTTYYWRVRVNAPVYSPYSIIYTLTVAEAEAPVTTVTVEPTPAPDITVTAPPAPEVTVTVPPVVIPPAAPAIPAVLLWTIVGIGAVLIIALIILIVRTRRVV